jgi:DNA invertase Pin-like site-specific DNA recombinase
MKETMRVCLYARVSKDEASSDGSLQNPENQLEPLRKYCQAMGYTIIKEYVDRASGGTANRPEFQSMLAKARQHHFDLIIIWSLDRFSREGITSTLSYIKQLKANKVCLKSFQEGWLDTSQEGVSELLLAILSWVAEQEKKRISERTKAGLNRIKEEGKILGRPKGWKKSKIEGVQNPSYKKLLKEQEI